MTLRKEKEIKDQIKDLEKVISKILNSTTEENGSESASACLALCWAVGSLMWAMGWDGDIRSAAVMASNKFKELRDINDETHIQAGWTKH
jgi:hypothetical protein